MDDLMSEFLTETAENLAVLDVELVKFERDPIDTDTLENIFRLVHTIKGTSGFLGLPRLEKVAHVGEDVLGKFRDGALKVTPEAVTLILRCIDTVRDILGELEQSGSEPQGDDSAFIAEVAGDGGRGNAARGHARRSRKRAGGGRDGRGENPGRGGTGDRRRPFPLGPPASGGRRRDAGHAHDRGGGSRDRGVDHRGTGARRGVGTREGDACRE